MMIGVMLLLMLLMMKAIMIHCFSTLWNRIGCAIFALATMVTIVKIWHQRLCKKEPTHVYMWHFKRSRSKTSTIQRENVGVFSPFLNIMQQLVQFSLSLPVPWTYFTVYFCNTVAKEVFFRRTKQCPGSMWLHLAPYILPDWKAVTHSPTLPDTSSYGQENREWSLKGGKITVIVSTEMKEEVGHSFTCLKLCQTLSLYVCVCGPSMAQLGWENRATQASGSNLRGCQNVG